MIPTLVWKEFREQRAVWVAMAVLTVVLIVCLVQFVKPEGTTPGGSSKAGMILIVVLVMAATHGLLCGSLMLAGERESGTLAFLDTLARARTSLWATKVTTGAMLTLGHAFLLMVVVLALSLQEARPATNLPLAGFLWLAILTLVEWAALACGLFFSALCHSVLAAVGLSGLVLVASVYGSMALGWITGLTTLGFVLVLGLLCGSTLGGSWWIFCRPDRERGTVVVPLGGFTPLLWLTLRQGRVGALILGLGGLVLAVVPQFSLLWWPVLTLLVGVLSGMGVFAADQGSGSHRFLGDQRFPPGRAWAVKIGCWLTLATGVASLLLVGKLITFRLENPLAMNEDILAHLFSYRNSAYFMGHELYLFLWLVYGFSISQLFALVVRKSLVGLILSLLVSVVLLVPWMPSLIWGGVGAWQVFAVPVFLVAASRLAMWPWFSGQLLGGRAAAYLVGGYLLTGAWMAGIFCYRVAAVPDVGEPFDVRAFEASLPTPEQNQAGLLIRQATGELQTQEDRVNRELGMPERELISYSSPLNKVLQNGWTEDNVPFGQWLDRTFEGKWASDLQKAAVLPLGVVFYPQFLDNLRKQTARSLCYEAGALLVARALQLQARGDDRLALDHLSWALALARNLRNLAGTDSYRAGLEIEQQARHAFNLWLRKVGPRAELLQRALDDLNRHEAQTPPADDCKKAEYLYCRHLVDTRWIVGITTILIPCWPWPCRSPGKRPAPSGC